MYSSSIGICFIPVAICFSSTSIIQSLEDASLNICRVTSNNNYQDQQLFQNSPYKSQVRQTERTTEFIVKQVQHLCPKLENLSYRRYCIEFICFIYWVLLVFCLAKYHTYAHPSPSKYDSAVEFYPLLYCYNIFRHFFKTNATLTTKHTRHQ